MASREKFICDCLKYVHGFNDLLKIKQYKIFSEQQQQLLY